MKKNLVIYPVIFSEVDGKVGVEVPDIGQVTFGDDLDNAFEEAQDLIGSYLQGLTDYPQPSDLKAIDLKEGEQLALVPVNMTKFLAGSKTVRRMVTVPDYLNEMAKEDNLNVSQVLTEALKAKLDA
ncbi:type II toxin-antitoxin system HicB family antitoxin [uncultured Secundilactobacillus sp.]|uniref:type II toxin-antitoxin system HicB family antitoxin n=1 Tax=uncultured Secundilactobacillus sp. TaxID=2813935 RepID=UPI002583D781|nr:type II toxin-antitoxin system HicB family antitoxin [uncultured Secundilactobacillus sp.]